MKHFRSRINLYDYSYQNSTKFYSYINDIEYAFKKYLTDE